MKHFYWNCDLAIIQLANTLEQVRLQLGHGLFAATASAAAPASKWALLIGSHWIPCKGGS
jgi:hypothetical protein